MTESDKAVMQQTFDVETASVQLRKFLFAAEYNDYLALILDGISAAYIAGRKAIAQPTALLSLTDQSIDAMWSNEKLTYPQLVNRRVIARAVEAAHAIAPPADLLQEDSIGALNLPIEDSPQG